MKVLNSPCIHVHYFIDLWHNTSLTVDNYVGKHCFYLINNNLTICMYCTRGATPYNRLYREALPERGTFIRLQVYKRVGISQV